MNKSKTGSHKKHRNIGIALACSTAFGGTVAATERPAHAAIDPASISAYIGLGISVVKLGQTIFGSSGEGADLKAKLDAVKDQVIGEMRTQRNAALVSNTRSVFSLFRNLADNAKGDPTNAGMWTEIVSLQQQTADAMYDIINNTNDTQSAYELTAAYNVLLVTGIDVLSIKKEIWSSYPSSWNDFFTWTQPGMATDYKLIGSQYHQCYPGYNPGYSKPPSSGTALAVWQASMKAGKYKDSVLWTKKLARKDIFAQTEKYKCTLRTGIIFREVKRNCNPGTKTCSPTPATIDWSCALDTVTSQCASGTAALACAEQLAKPGFDADPAVQVARASMRAMMTVSGGNDYDAATNSPLVRQGKIVDPYVDEPSCGASGPWAYAHMP